MRALLLFTPLARSKQDAHSLYAPPRSPRAALLTPPPLPAGFLVSVDAYMNLQLASTEEYIDGAFTGNLGEVLIRCNNVLYLRGAPEEAAGGGAAPMAAAVEAS